MSSPLRTQGFLPYPTQKMCMGQPMIKHLMFAAQHICCDNWDFVLVPLQKKAK